MAITDELRKYAANFMSNVQMHRVLAIADRIDAEHEHEMEERADRYSELRAKMNNCYVELPKDADGEYIRIGDELRDGWHEQNQGEVERLMLDHHGWWLMLKSCPERFYVHEFHEWHHRHHKQPTVEDVLRKLVGRAHTLGCIEEEDALVAEYAKKLQLRGDE